MYMFKLRHLKLRFECNLFTGGVSKGTKGIQTMATGLAGQWPLGWLDNGHWDGWTMAVADQVGSRVLWILNLDSGTMGSLLSKGIWKESVKTKCPRIGRRKR